MDHTNEIDNLRLEIRNIEKNLVAEVLTCKTLLAKLETRIQSLSQQSSTATNTTEKSTNRRAEYLLQKDIYELKKQVQQLQEDVNILKQPKAEKEDLLPYVEKLASIDLFPIDWKKYQKLNTK